MVVLFFPKKFILNLSPPKKLNKYPGTSKKNKKMSNNATKKFSYNFNNFF